jgi:hypothetical protein
VSRTAGHPHIHGSAFETAATDGQRPTSVGMASAPAGAMRGAELRRQRDRGGVQTSTWRRSRKLPRHSESDLVVRTGERARRGRCGGLLTDDLAGRPSVRVPPAADRWYGSECVLRDEQAQRDDHGGQQQDPQTLTGNYSGGVSVRAGDRCTFRADCGGSVARGSP